jgi:2-haloacid dehalogenase
MKPKAFVFDAYGTLFDITCVVLRAGNNIPGDLNALSTLWRQKQLEYTWLRSLMEHYEDFWDVTEAALRSAVMQGSPKMLASAVRHNGLEHYFAQIISVDRAKTYKPSPRVYALGAELLELPVSEILFVSSNSWDVAGAKAFGYKVCWCNRPQGTWRILASRLT